MSNERPNEFMSWRGQLTAPDALPEKGLDDKEQSWQRLAERFQKQPRRRGIAWWIAAACLILAFFFPATHLFRGRPARPNRIAHHPSVQRQPVTLTQSRPVTPAQSQPVTPSSPGKNTLPVQSAPKPNHLQNSNYGDFATITSPTRPGTPTRPAIHPRTAIPARSGTPAGATEPTVATLTPTPVSIIPDPAPDLAPNLAPNPAPNLAPALAPLLAAAPGNAPPTRKPLRIVYLNEISKDPGQSPALASRQPAFLRLSTAADWTINHDNTPIIKIDISSPNH